MSSKQMIQKLKRSFNTIATPKLAFRLMSRSDSFPLHSATQHPDFNAHLIWDQPETELHTVNQVDLLIREDRNDEAVLVTVVEKYTGAWVGMIKITSYRESVRFGVWIHPDYWGKLYTMRAIEVAIDMVFKNTDLDVVYARVKKDYALVQKIVTKLGASYLEPDSVPHENGSIMEDAVWQLLRKDWNVETNIVSY